MKNIIAIIFICLISGQLFSQIEVASNNKVGIGIANPSVKLDVDGYVKVRGNELVVGSNPTQNGVRIEVGKGRETDGHAFIDLIGDNSFQSDYGFRMFRWKNGKSELVHRGTRGYFDLRTAHSEDIRFLTNDTERMRVKSGGNVGIGITSPSTKLHVNGGITYVGSLNNASDKRLKTNIEDFEYGLEELMKLVPKTYNYNDLIGFQDTYESHVGLLAQDLNKIAPELVSEFEYIAEDDNRRIQSKNTYLNIKESAIKYILVNAVKEQQTQIEVLREEIELIKKQCECLRSNANIESVDKLVNDLVMNVYPNPSNGEVNVEVKTDLESEAKLAIIDNQGRRVYSIDVELPMSKHLSLSHLLTEGSYYVQLLDIKGATLGIEKFIIGK